MKTEKVFNTETGEIISKAIEVVELPIEEPLEIDLIARETVEQENPDAWREYQQDRDLSSNHIAPLRRLLTLQESSD